MRRKYQWLVGIVHKRKHCRAVVCTDRMVLQRVFWLFGRKSEDKKSKPLELSLQDIIALDIRILSERVIVQ